MKFRQSIILTVCLLGVLSCEKKPPEPVKPVSTESWEKLDQDGITISYPEDWFWEKNGPNGVAFQLLSPKESEDDSFRDNVNLLIQELPGDDEIDLAQYVRISEQQIPALFSNGKLQSSDRKEKNDRQYQDLTYQGDQGGYKLKFRQYYWIENGKAYVLTLTCERDQFDKYLPIGKAIMDSLRF